MEDKLKVCQACLSSDRILHKTSDINILLGKIDLQINVGGICWECRGIVWKCFRFRNQVLQAQKILQNVEQQQDLQSLSSLAFTKTETFEQTTTNCNQIDSAGTEHINITFQKNVEETNKTVQSKHSEHDSRQENKQESQKNIQETQQVTDGDTAEDKDKDASDKHKKLQDTDKNVINVEDVDDTNGNLPKITMVKSIEDADMDCIYQRNNSTDIIEFNINIPCILIEDDDEEDIEQQNLDNNEANQGTQSKEFQDQEKTKDLGDSSIQIYDLENETRNLEDVIVHDVQFQNFPWSRTIKQEKIDELIHNSNLYHSDIKNELLSELDTTPEFSIEVKAEPLSPEPSAAGREYHLWKKSVLQLYSRLRCHRYSSTFMNPIRDEIAPSYSQVVKRPMDLKTIARNVRHGFIRNTAEFQRDLLLMLVNATMYNNTQHVVHHMAKDFLEEVKYQLGILLTVQETTCMNVSRAPRAKRRLPTEHRPAATSTPTKKAKIQPAPVFNTRCYVKMEKIDLTDLSLSDESSPFVAYTTVKVEKAKNTPAPISGRRQSSRLKTMENSAKTRNNIEKSKESSAIKAAKRLYSTRKSISGVIGTKEAKTTKNTSTTEKNNDNTNQKSTKAAKRTYAARKSFCSVSEAKYTPKTAEYTTAIEKLKDTAKVSSSTKAAKRVYAGRKSCSGVIETRDTAKTKDKSDKRLETENKEGLWNMYYTQYTVPLKDATAASKVQKRRRTIGTPTINTKETDPPQKPKKYSRKNSNSEAKLKPKRLVKKQKQPEVKQKRKYTKRVSQPNETSDKLAEMLLNVSTCFENMMSEDEANKHDLESTTEDLLNPRKKRRPSAKSCLEIPGNIEEISKPQKRKLCSLKTKEDPKEKTRKRRRKKETVSEKDVNVVTVDTVSNINENIVKKGPKTSKNAMKDINNSMLENTSLLTPKKKRIYRKKIDKIVSEKKTKVKKEEGQKVSSKDELNDPSTKIKESPKIAKKVKVNKPKNKVNKTKDKVPKIPSIKLEKDTASAPSNSPEEKTDAPFKEAPLALTTSKIQILSSKVVKPNYQNLKLESSKIAHSTPKEPCSVTGKFEDSLCLATAITTEPMRDLTREESGMIKKSLEDAIMEISLDAKRFAPKFRGKPIIADGVVKLWCEDHNTLHWLGDIVSKIKGIPDLVVRKQCELPKKIKCAILLPGNEDFEVIKRLLKAQNTWALVDSWLHHSIEQRGENMYLVVGIPSTVIPALEGKERRLAYSLGSVDVQFLKEDSNVCELSPEND